MARCPSEVIPPTCPIDRGKQASFASLNDEDLAGFDEWSLEETSRIVKNNWIRSPVLGGVYMEQEQAGKMQMYIYIYTYIVGRIVLHFDVHVWHQNVRY